MKQTRMPSRWALRCHLGRVKHAAALNSRDMDFGNAIADASRVMRRGLAIDPRSIRLSCGLGRVCRVWLVCLVRQGESSW